MAGSRALRLTVWSASQSPAEQSPAEPHRPRATKPGGWGRMRPHSSAPINVLRAALAGPFLSLSGSAEKLITEAMRLSSTLTEAADDLGISLEALRRLRADFPRLDRLAGR